MTAYDPPQPGARVGPTYRMAATVEIARDPSEVARWLIEPELLHKWVIGAQSVKWVTPDAPKVGSEVRMKSGSGRINFTLIGTFVELSERSIVKRFVLDTLRMSDMLAFDRTVRYLLERTGAGTRLHTTVDVFVDGLPQSVVRRSAAVEQRAVERSLERLRSAVEGRRRSLWSRLRDDGQSPQIL